MFPSNYLKASDFEDGDSTLTIKRLDEETIGSGKEAKDVWVVYFREQEKGLVLNKTNSNVIAGLYGDDTDDWKGKQVTLYETEVQFQDKMVPAIRIRSKPPKKAAAKPVKAAVAEPAEDTEEDDDSQIPF
jgi:hypothetical protein